MHTKLIRIALALALMFTAACGKKKAPPHPHAITQADADAIAERAPSDDFRDVEFDDNYVLLGVSGSKGARGFELQLAWKSMKKQPLEHLVAIHAVNSEGKIVGQADYKQNAAVAEVEANTIWRDSVVIPYEKLAGAVNVGIGLMAEGQQWLLADRGPRDWDERRLLFPLPKDLPEKPSRFIGFLEAAHAENIVGWVWNPDEPSKRVEVEITDGATVLAKVVADKPRTDLVGKVGDGNYGFSIETPAALKDGKPHEIRAKIVGEGVELRNSPKILQGK